MLSHYRLAEQIGKGGMGIVHKAFDTKLNRHVALKILPSELTTDPERRRRFEHEARAAAALNHPNIATVHEIDEAEGVLFIAMELLEGQTLRSLIAGQPLPMLSAVRVATGIAQGLAHAHAAGVIHRDLKPENVVLVDDLRPKILDFGIARLLPRRGEYSTASPNKEETILTREGWVVGTAAYMSPEQARGERVDARSDIFSLGVLLYETLTGRAPFKRKTDMETLAAILRDSVIPASKTNPRVTADLEQIVGRCLEKDPERRYQRAEDLLRDLTRERRSEFPRLGEPRRRHTAIALAVAVVLLAGTTLLLVQRSRPAPGASGRLSVAVLPFENKTARADLDWLRTGIAENLSADLAQSKFIRVVAPERISQILKDSDRSRDHSGATDGFPAIAEYGGATAVVRGAFIAEGDKIRISLFAQMADSGELMGSAVVDGREAGVLALIDELTVRTKEILDVSTERDARDTDRRIGSARTSSLEAASLFQKGVDFIYQGQNLEAIAPLEQSTDADPDFALAYARLSQAYLSLGYDEKAKAAGEAALSKVLKAVDRVTPADRASIRAAHAAAAHNGQEAIEAYEEMVKADPFDAAAAFNLGHANEDTGAWDKAEVFYRKALEIDPKYAAAQNAVGRIKVLGSHPEESLPEFQKALDLYRKMGSKEGEASAYQGICNAQNDLRRWDEALTYCGKSAAIKEAIGDKRGLAASLESMAYAYLVSGSLDKALTSAEKTLAICKEIGDERGIASSLSTIAGIHEDRGNLQKALKYREESLAAWQEIGDQAFEAEILQSLGGLKIQLGDPAGAEKDLASAAALCQRLGNQEGIAQVVSDEGILALIRGDLTKADELLTRALSQWQALSSQEGVAEAQYRQAMVAVHRGLYATAVRLSGQALADYRKAGDKLNSARCLLVEGMALLRSGDEVQAGQTLDSAQESAAPLNNPILMADLEAARAETHLALGESGKAEPLIRSLCRRASETGLARLQLSCSFMNGLAALAAHDTSSSLALAAEAVLSAGRTRRAFDALEASVLKVRAQSAAGDGAAAAATGTALIEQAAKTGAHDIVVRAAGATGGALARIGRRDQIVAVASALQTSLQAIRLDLPRDQIGDFVQRGLDTAGCRQIADALKKVGRGADAERIEALLGP